jgi:hypothetical protein
MKRLLVVVFTCIIILSACQQTQTEESLYDTWDGLGMYMVFNDDGSWFEACTVDELESNPNMYGTFTFDGKLLTIFTEETRYCPGETGIYEVEFPKEGFWDVTFTLVEDPCQDRAKVMRRGMDRYSP